jgi:hypothetical protein
MAGEKHLEKGQHHGNDRVSLERRNEARLGQGNHSRKHQPFLTPDQENGNGRELSRGVGGGEKRAKTGGGGAAIKAASAKSGIKGFSDPGRLAAVSPRVTEAALWETVSDIRAIAGEAQAQALSA